MGEMNYRSLGRSGLKVSELSLGGWMTFGRSVKDSKIAKQIITKAYESGINFFDIADIYATGESEKMMGKVLSRFARHTLVISSKVFWPMSDDVNDKGLSRKHIMESIEKSLARIKTDYLDMYFCHRYDEETPLEETIRAMDDLVHQGKILYWGTSEWTGKQIEEAVKFCEKNNLYKPVVEQPQYSLLAREKFEGEIMPTASKLGMGLVTWSPLASGLLTGKYDDGLPDGARISTVDWLQEEWYTKDNLKRVKAFKKVADGMGVTRADLALAWAIRHPEISSVITGATKIEQVEANLKAAELSLPKDVLTELDKVFSKN
jgi:voltage-dependent potassium channel beta subunit